MFGENPVALLVFFQGLLLCLYLRIRIRIRFILGKTHSLVGKKPFSLLFWKNPFVGKKPFYLHRGWSLSGTFYSFIFGKTHFCLGKNLFIGKPLAILGKKPIIANQCHIYGVL